MRVLYIRVQLCMREMKVSGNGKCYLCHVRSMLFAAAAAKVGDDNRTACVLAAGGGVDWLFPAVFKRTT